MSKKPDSSKSPELTPLEQAKIDSDNFWADYEKRITTLEKKVNELSSQLHRISREKHYLWEGHDVPI